MAFQEYIKPKVVDIYRTRDRVKIRIGEPGQHGKYWLNLTYDTSEEAIAFAEDLLAKLEAPTPAPDM